HPRFITPGSVICLAVDDHVRCPLGVRDHEARHPVRRDDVDPLHVDLVEFRLLYGPREGGHAEDAGESRGDDVGSRREATRGWLVCDVGHDRGGKCESTIRYRTSALGRCLTDWTARTSA